MRRPWIRYAAMLLAAMAASGCASLAELIAEPHGESLGSAQERALLRRAWGLERSSSETPAGVHIAYLHVPAGDRGWEVTLQRQSLEFRTAHSPKAIPVRGSVVYLHGWGMDSTSMLGWAMAFAEHGYDGYALDLRNHGASDRAPAGYGTREAADVASVVAQLEATGQLRPPVYLFGVSLGASTALFAEPDLQGIVAGIIAMEPYANAADAVRGTIDGLLAARPAGFGARIRQRLARWRFGHADRDAAIADASARLGLDLASVDLAPVAARSRTCTLLLHGGDDRWLRPDASRELAARSPQIHFLRVPGEDHESLPRRIDWLAGPILGWMAAAGAGHCGPVTLPANPLPD